MNLVLVAALCAAAPAPGDIAFLAGVERFAFEARGVAHFEGALDPDLLDALRAMACEHHRGREVATGYVRLHPGGFRAACWGANARNPEIRARCLRLLREYARCPHCGGSGFCPAKILGGRGGGEGTSYLPGYCPDCDRAADPLRRVLPWDHPFQDRLRLRCRACDGFGDLFSPSGIPRARKP